MTLEARTGLLSNEARSFLAATPPRYATIATVNRDGSPHQTLIWYELRGEEIVVNSRIGRRWPANLRRDPHANFSVYDRADAVTLECEVALSYTGAAALADISAMAHRYADADEVEELIEEWRRQERVTFVLRPTRVHLAGNPG